VPQVRVVAEDGEEFGVMDTRDAIRSAREKGMDLVEVAPNAELALQSAFARTPDVLVTSGDSAVDTVRRLADKANIGMPDVAVYEGAPNAFATGAFKNSALVAVSTGLLESMSRDEVEAVLGHEVTHVANGDMVTLTLIQGVLNTFVFFLSRVVGFIVDKAVFRTERGIGPGYYITVIVSQIVFGILAAMIVMWFSRQREFRADAGSARLLGTPQPMIGALRRLGGMQPGALPQSLAAAGVNGAPGWMALFSSHPPIEERIAALQGRT